MKKDEKAKAIRQLAREISDLLKKSSFVDLLRMLTSENGVAVEIEGKSVKIFLQSSASEAKTSLRKLYDTVNKYSSGQPSEVAAAKIYAAVAHTAARQKRDVFSLVEQVAKDYLLNEDGDLKDRIERFKLFLEVIVAISG